MLKVKQLFGSRISPQALYAAIVARARQSKFYADMAVPDTMEGRLNMLVLTLSLVLNRLKAEGRGEFAQALVDAFFADVEANFRELGASDKAVAQKMRKLEEIYFGAVKAYSAAIAISPAAFAEAIKRNVLTGEDNQAANTLADECLVIMSRLQSASIADIEAGRVQL
jgi:cytochrome b pre-mRNA-processing protein 3